MVKRFYTGSGRYNVRLVFQNDSGKGFVDEYGNKAELIEDQFERWAEVIPGSGREFVANQQIQAEQDHTIRVRCDRDTKQLTTNWQIRVKRTSRILNIIAIRNVDNRNEELVIAAKELVKDG